jgi:hypothetical protein
MLARRNRKGNAMTTPMGHMIEADYLVVGAGALGMAFADTVLHESDATVAMVDRYGAPGGHWTRAYPFVRLHQPSAFYGVNSKALGRNEKDTATWNAGLFELASGAEVVAYFDQLMQQEFLPSGRVQFFPMCEYAEAERSSRSSPGKRKRYGRARWWMRRTRRWRCLRCGHRRSR